MHVRRVCDDTRLMVTLEDPSSGAAGDVGSQLVKKHLAVSTAPTLVYSGPFCGFLNGLQQRYLATTSTI